MAIIGNRRFGKNVGRWIGMIAGVVAIIEFLVASCNGGGLTGKLNLWSHKIVSLPSQSSFMVTKLADRFGRDLEIGDTFSYQFGLPLDARGVTQLNNTDKVWAVARDRYGNHYLQNPPVTIRESQWTASNLRPQAEVVSIIFLKVDSSGDAFLSEQARRSRQSTDWLLPALPPNGTVVGEIVLR